MDRTEVVTKLVDYFAEMEKTVDADTHLIAHDVIDSLGMLDLVEFIEDTFEVPIDQSMLVMENFATVGRVADTVLAAASS